MAQTIIISEQGSKTELFVDLPGSVCNRSVIGLLQFSGKVPSNPRYVNIHTDLTHGFFVNGVQDNMISHITNLSGGVVNINYEPAQIKWCVTFPQLALRRRARFWFTDETGADLVVEDPDLTVQIA